LMPCPKIPLGKTPCLKFYTRTDTLAMLYEGYRIVHRLNFNWVGKLLHRWNKA